VPGAGPKLDQPWENSLGMKFVPAGTPGILFCVWDTRVQDYQAYAEGFLKSRSPYLFDGKHAEELGKVMSRFWPKPFFEQGPTHPAVNVSWDEAKLFCRWLTKKERDEGKLGANQIYRLPKDAEWSREVGLENDPEGMKTGRFKKIEGRYPWGTAYPPPREAGNYLRKGDENIVSSQSDLKGSDGFAYTSPVGSFPPNRHGLYDIGGNVWQWGEDVESYGIRAMRGGSWFVSRPEDRLSSARGWASANSGAYDYGFRCVIAPVP
jgi:eukaryotic-like serine/threonine-protein kinase